MLSLLLIENAGCLKAIMIWLLALKQTNKKIKDDDNDVLMMDDE